MNTTLRTLLIAIIALAPAGAGLDAASWSSTGAIPADVSIALVRVEAFLQSAHGEKPDAAGWRSRCPNCGNHHVSDVDEAVREERPVTVAGFLVSDDRVILADPIIPARFVREWRVRRGDDVVPARIEAYALDRPAVRLVLEKPLKDARPLRFEARGKAPYFTITYTGTDDGFGAQVAPLGASWIVKDDGRRFLPVPAQAVVVTGEGRPVALTLREELPAGDGWKGSPDAWSWLSAEDYGSRCAALEDAASHAVLRAELVYRQRPTQPGENAEMHYGSADREPPTSALAIVIAPERILVLATLRPRQTAALERVQLKLPDGREVAAAFRATVAELGAFVVVPDAPMDRALPVSPEPWGALRGRLGLALNAQDGGERIEFRSAHLRMVALKDGPRGRAVPEFPGHGPGRFLFDTEGRLLGVPVTARPPATQERWRSEGRPFVLHAAELARYACDPEGFADMRNVPLSAAEEGRLAWLGVELQPIDESLAQVHQVAGQVQNGEGALVIHVYPDSPAARSGLQVGDVLLRIQPAGAATPMPVEAGPSRFTLDPFPWDQYDELPEPYYDQVPAPWQPAESAVTHLLRDLGFGTSYTLEYAREGAVHAAAMEVEPGPLHFATAPQVESSPLGLTVRELTFETRRYYRLAEPEPGLVVARVLPGSRASVAGLKPFEIVVAINDQPVRTAAEFEAAVQQANPIVMSVRRMHQTRVVSFAGTPLP